MRLREGSVQLSGGGRSPGCRGPSCTQQHCYPTESFSPPPQGGNREGRGGNNKKRGDVLPGKSSKNRMQRAPGGGKQPDRLPEGQNGVRGCCSDPPDLSPDPGEERGKMAPSERRTERKTAREGEVETLIDRGGGSVERRGLTLKAAAPRLPRVVSLGYDSVASDVMPQPLSYSTGFMELPQFSDLNAKKKPRGNM